jgi:hypothetical protein
VAEERSLVHMAAGNHPIRRSIVPALVVLVAAFIL